MKTTMLKSFRGGAGGTALCLAGWLYGAPVTMAAAAPVPEISLSWRGVADGIVEQGEPLRITVRLRAPRGASEAITLAPASGTWADAVRVELVSETGDGGVAAAASAVAVGKPDAALAMLDDARVAGGLWQIQAAAMQRVVPGNYMVRATLVIAVGNGWKGEVVSAARAIKVVAVSDASDRVAQRTLNRAHEALLAGRMEEAVSMLDAQLERTPDDGRLLIVRADIADRAGNPAAALVCLNRARFSSALAGVGQPSIEQEELQTRVMASLSARKDAPGAPPAWTWPPAAVLTIASERISALAKTGAVRVLQ